MGNGDDKRWDIVFGSLNNLNSKMDSILKQLPNNSSLVTEEQCLSHRQSDRSDMKSIHTFMWGAIGILGTLDISLITAIVWLAIKG